LCPVHGHLRPDRFAPSRLRRLANPSAVAATSNNSADARML